jgi:hypothetical protein
MTLRNSWIRVVMCATGLALANNGQTSQAPAEGANHAAASDHGAYFAPSMRFDAAAGNLEVTFGIEEGARISLQAFDTRGKLLATLLDGDQGSGFHHLSLFSNRLQGYQGHVIFQLRSGASVLAETRSRSD